MADLTESSSASVASFSHTSSPKKKKNRNSNSNNRHVVLNIPEDIEGQQEPAAAAHIRRQKFIGSRGLQSSLSSVSQRFEYDDNLLHRAVEDAGRWAYGTILVEMWVLSDDKTCLHRPPSGWWVDDQFHSRECCDEDCKICRLLNSQRKTFVPPRPLVPGEGLPGVLWAEANSKSSSWLQGARSWSGGGGGGGGSHHRTHRRSMAEVTPKVFSDALPKRHVTWRQVKTIAEDPDQPWNQRLLLLGELGLGWAAAVPFSLHGQQGIMIYMCRDSVDLELLQTPDNEDYLKAASDFAGAAYALRRPRQKMEQARYRERAAAWRRVRARILFLIRRGTSLKDFVEAQQAEMDQEVTTVSTAGVSIWDDCAAMVKEKLLAVLRKSRGGGAQPPPPFSWRQTWLTFVGVLVTLMLVARLNVRLTEDHGGDYTIVMGPFGALVTLLYGLTAAPASQPRNAILGQAVSLSIAMLSTYMDDASNFTTGFALWMRQSIVTALAVAAMVRLGITHPPAGASALIFASGHYDWTHVLTFFCGNVIAISTATVVNNMSNKRQYPIYWGLEFLEQHVRDLREERRATAMSTEKTQ